ncbi:hypothetical protein A1D31_22160 [Bradyrhizobium liaoningense]|nr:hypothetical protein A1D31_22160 [Bradyrhizobium liaoningense]
MRNGIIIIAAMTGGLLWLGGAFNSEPSKPTQTEPEKTAADAAAVGDIVTVLWPASTIMCSERDDASKVYIVGENAMRQTWRIENSAMKAVQAKSAARKQAMSQAPSCEWAPEKISFIVKKKEIIGDKASLYHVATYCLKPENKAGSDCWWISDTATNGPQVKRIGRASDNKI